MLNLGMTFLTAATLINGPVKLTEPQKKVFDLLLENVLTLNQIRVGDSWTETNESVFVLNYGAGDINCSGSIKTINTILNVRNSAYYILEENKYDFNNSLKECQDYIQNNISSLNTRQVTEKLVSEQFSVNPQDFSTIQSSEIQEVGDKVYKIQMVSSFKGSEQNYSSIMELELDVNQPAYMANKSVNGKVISGEETDSIKILTEVHKSRTKDELQKLDLANVTFCQISGVSEEGFTMTSCEETDVSDLVK